jgi:hypothetical protein
MVVRKELLEMNKRGHLLMKYRIEENVKLLQETILMLLKDRDAQMLLGDKLKQDQFKFFYETCKIIYDSALKTHLLNYEQNLAQIDEVISMLLAYESLILIKNIQLAKAEDVKKAAEKLKRDGPPKEPEPEVIEEKKPDPPAKPGQKKVVHEEVDEEAQKLLREQAALEEEIKRYGRTWMWEGYFNEKNKN